MDRLRPLPGMMSWATTFLAGLAFFSIFPLSVTGTSYVTWANDQGQTIYLANDRYPALYTGDFGDCLNGQSLVNVTQLDAAYYQDNSTVLFHIAGTTNLKNESIMMLVTVEAYGQDQFDLIFNPCSANINSLCPMNSSLPIYAEAIIPVGQADVAGIPSIALVIPDFEGTTTLRFYSNATQTEIACFRAVMKNGATFSYPAAIGSVLGVFVFAALIASFLTAIYGVNLQVMRTHYAHSLSVLVVFETLQSIFFSGALSLNWPSVCVAFWSNFAWSAGMIYSPSLTNSINKFLGANLGNSSQVGGAGSVTLNNNGGAQIYGRSMDLDEIQWKRAEEFRKTEELAKTLYSRGASTNASSTGPGYSWNGSPAKPGLAPPGSFGGFAGELGQVNIPVSDAFLTGFVWFLILLVTIVASTIAFKWLLEGLIAVKWIKRDRLAFFRSHWLGFLAVIVLRTLFIGFFMIMTLALYQFNLHGGAGVTAIAAIIFILFLVGIFSIVGYACFYRLRLGRYESVPDRIRFHGRKVMKVFPWFGADYDSALKEKGKKSRPSSASLPLFRIRYINENADRQSVHEDEDYIKRFGWLAARFRRSRWWYFSVWTFYQFIRACFVGGAASTPEAQVFGLLIVEIIALIAIVKLNPFEGARNTALAVYMLGISKVITAGLSVAFVPRYKFNRIITTVLGMVIIVVQGFLTIALLILITLGVVSTWFSLSRNQETFRMKSWEGMRFKYFTNLEKKAPDVPAPPPPMPEVPKEPYFSVNTVRRAPKIEDEDDDFISEMAQAEASQFSIQGRQNSTRPSRSNSIKSNRSGHGNAPYGARMHRLSWSTSDFATWEETLDNSPPQRSASRTGGAAYYQSRMNTPTPPTPLNQDLIAMQSSGSLQAASPQDLNSMQSSGSLKAASRQDMRAPRSSASLKGASRQDHIVRPSSAGFQTTSPPPTPTKDQLKFFSAQRVGTPIRRDA